MTHRNPRARGFALLVVMMIVAVVALGAAALLDLVNVDIGVAAEHRKILAAESASVGALLETVIDPSLGRRLPTPTAPDLQTRLVERSGGAYIRDPDGVYSTVPMDPDDSMYIENVGTNLEDGYESEVTLVRINEPIDSTLSLPKAVFEVRTKATISGGDASSETRALLYRYVIADTETQNQRHGR